MPDYYADNLYIMQKNTQPAMTNINLCFIIVSGGENFGLAKQIESCN